MTRVLGPHRPTCRYGTYIRLHVCPGGRGRYLTLHV